MDTSALRKFYFSGASNFSSFSKSMHSASKQASADTTVDEPTSVHEVTVATPILTRPVTVDPQVKGGGASHVTAVRSIVSQQSHRVKVERQRASMPPDAATSEYMAFLRQGQELQRLHQSMVEALDTLVNCRRDQQSTLTKLRSTAQDLLATIESDHDWKLRSKYNVSQLTKDCGLKLSIAELIPEVAPSTVAMDAMLTNLNGLKAKYGESLQFAPYALLVEQAARRVGVLEASLKEGNSDSTPLCRHLDTLIVQLEDICKLPTMEATVAGFENDQQRILCTIDGYRHQRAAATDDGEVNVAERLCYDIIEEYERALGNTQRKMEVLELGLLQTEGRREVCLKCQTVPRREFKAIRERAAALVDTCRKDIGSMYSLRQKIEEVEAQTQKKVAADCRKSDETLQKNAARQVEVFAQIEQLLQELQSLERERHVEIQRRLADKDKDEHRRAEHAQFCATVDSHTIPLERTIRNMDLLAHASEVLSELAETGFDTIRSDLDSQDALYRRILLTARKEHLELVRQLMLELGDVVRRKENKISETEDKIRQAHIQQELLSETYNPNAKKFGDIKKQLLGARDELEQDVVLLKQRAEAALRDFEPSEKALQAANVSFVHPITEQEQHHTLKLSKLVELKAITAGAPRGTSLNTQAQAMQTAAEELCRMSASVNDEAALAVSMTIPQVRAATRKLRTKEGSTLTA